VLTLPHEIVDLAEEVLRSLRLGDKPAVVGNVGRGRFYLTGCDHQKDVRPTRMDLARQVQSIATGHPNVSEEPHAVVGPHDLSAASALLASTTSIERFDIHRDLRARPAIGGASVAPSA
jgi:hypothetical protein